jgi:acyl-CoA synthetase (AMP-forming)/AMP-acid ligase II
MQTFTVNPNFILRYNRRNYTTDELSQAVSYWLDQIHRTEPNLPIGVAYAGLSFSAVALILALYKSGRDFYHLGVHSRSLNHDTQNNLQLSHIFVVGNTNDISHFVNIPQIYTRTDSWHHAYECASWIGRTDLTIPFSPDQYVYAYTSGTTGAPQLTKMSAYNESISISIAQQTFFNENDYCVFLHGMSHQGVHTTAILPGIFTASVVSFADTDTWNEEIEHATHTQYFYTMKDLYPLPKQLRVITTGGDMLKPVFLEHIQSQCSYEHLFDIYGLTECLPPLAVRDIHAISDLTKDFVWINQEYMYNIQADGRISITRPDGQVFVTSDRGTKTEVGLQFAGRNFSAIRLRGSVVSIVDFKQEFELATKVVRYAIEAIPTGYVLHALKTDFVAVDRFLQTNYVDIETNYVDTLNTNGGIKNVV